MYLLAVAYILAGINHFRSSETYNSIMPSYIPYPYIMIYVTGIIEAMLGILLLFTKTRRFAAWGIIALLVFVFPANIQMLINYIQENNPKLWIAIVRLPLQIPLIYWAFTFARQTPVKFHANV